MRTIGRRSSVEETIAELHAELAAGTWRPGEQIPTEAELGAELGVSRTVVREAVRALVHLGVLESRQGAGTYVLSGADPTPMLRQLRRAKVRDVFESQLALDVQAARLAALNRGAEDLDRLRGLLDRRDRDESPDGFAQADAEFHLAVVQATGNPVLLEIYRYFTDRLREGLAALRTDGSIVESGTPPHEDLLRAITDGDPDAAEAAARASIEPSLQDLDESGGNAQ